MSNHEMFGAWECTLDSLMDENYSYLQEDYIAEESLFPVFGNTPNKRKPHNRRYEWEVMADD